MLSADPTLTFLKIALLWVWMVVAVMRVWEHALRDERWIHRLSRMLGKQPNEIHVSANPAEAS